MLRVNTMPTVVSEHRTGNFSVCIFFLLEKRRGLSTTKFDKVKRHIYIHQMIKIITFTIHNNNANPNVAAITAVSNMPPQIISHTKSTLTSKSSTTNTCKAGYFDKPVSPPLSPAPPPSHDSFYGLRKLTFLCPRRFFFSDCVSSNEWMPLAKRPTFAVWPAHSVGIPSENEANGQTHTHTHACKSMHKHGCDRK